MLRLYIVRHGSTDWNALGRLQGQTDTPLNRDGLRQAELLRERLRDTYREAPAKAGAHRVQLELSDCWAPWLALEPASEGSPQAL